MGFRWRWLGWERVLEEWRQGWVSRRLALGFARHSAWLVMGNLWWFARPAMVE